ncbi:UNVERIFIED_CONTAM: hypothetical protein FKN15_072428 [Acipenser sinensis]
MAAPIITGGVIRDKRFLRWVGETLEFRWLLNKDPECDVFTVCPSGYDRDPNSVIFSISTELPQTTLTLETPFPEIFTGETVTLRCGVEGGSAGWKYLWYKDSEDTPGLQTAGRSITGDSYTITAAAVSDQGQYCCRGQRGDPPRSSQLSNPVTLTVSGEFINRRYCKLD